MAENDIKYIEPEFNLKHTWVYFKRLFNFELIQEGFINKTPQILAPVHEKGGLDIKTMAKKGVESAITTKETPQIPAIMHKKGGLEGQTTPRKRGWMAHLEKTYKEMKLKNPEIKYREAMKAAKETYKKEDKTIEG